MPNPPAPTRPRKPRSDKGLARKADADLRKARTLRLTDDLWKFATIQARKEGRRSASRWIESLVERAEIESRIL